MYKISVVKEGILAQSNAKLAASTQENLEIAGVEDSIVILKDGSYRLVIEVTAVNFGLKSEREQNSIIFQFQGFLNSLHFPIEILVQSRKLDLTPYLTKLRKRSSEQTIDLLKTQTLDYIDFISELINMANIMKKRFYVVIGWENIELQNLSFVDKLLNRGNSVSLLKISEKDFKTHSNELRERANVIAGGLGSIGLHCKQLTTGELIELYYNFYNPGIADKERLGDLETLQANIVSRKDAGGKIDVQKPANTIEETPVIDNTEYVREQDKMKKQAEAAEAAEKAKSAPTAKAPAPVAKEDKSEPTKPAADKSQIQSSNVK
ncbi:MAG: hypothetical protein NTY30_00685 [Candidatus Berkelbacteria bacterium]|nr:hypothetical protein [Candidatus Berkelbacteria bacterium]